MYRYEFAISAIYRYKFIFTKVVTYKFILVTFLFYIFRYVSIWITDMRYVSIYISDIRYIAIYTCSTWHTVRQFSSSSCVCVFCVCVWYDTVFWFHFWLPTYKRYNFHPPCRVQNTNCPLFPLHEHRHLWGRCHHVVLNRHLSSPTSHCFELIDKTDNYK